MSKKDNSNTNATGTGTATGNAPAEATDEPQAPATGEATPAAVETPKRTKAPAGSSLEAQSKVLVLAIERELEESELSFEGLLLNDTVDWLKKVAAEIREKSSTSLPLVERLANAQKERNTLYANVQVVNGKPVFTPEWNIANDALGVKIANYQRAIKKEAETAKAKAEAETAKNGTTLDAESADKS